MSRLRQLTGATASTACFYDCRESVASAEAVPSEPCRAASHGRRVRRAEFLAGRRCASELLSALGSLCTGVPVGPNGRPVWPAGYVGSISHSEGLAIAAVNRTCNVDGIGIDCQKLLTQEVAARVAGLVARRCECGTSLSEAPTLVTVLFSVKESAFKAVSQFAPGLSFLGFHVTEISDRTVLLEITSARVRSDTPTRYHTVLVHYGIVGSYALSFSSVPGKKGASEYEA